MSINVEKLRATFEMYKGDVVRGGDIGDMILVLGQLLDVYEAACAWRDADVHRTYEQTNNELVAAVDAARKESP